MSKNNLIDWAPADLNVSLLLRYPRGAPGSLRVNPTIVGIQNALDQLRNHLLE
jgi:hypothetical protein